jgi:hypothetical protein
MKLKILSTFLALLVACAVCARSSTEEKHSREMGLSVAQLRNLVNSLPPLPGTIEAVQFLRTDGFWIDRAAILTQGESSGWQIFVFHIESNGKFALEWKSGHLDDSFAVSSAGQFQTHDVAASEQALEFSGCAAHICPDVFSVMFYVPSKKTAFTATYIWGKVTYTPASDGPMYRYYKMDLDRFIAEHRNIAN